MRLAYRWKSADGGPDEVRFLRGPRGACAAGARQTNLQLHEDPDGCDRLAGQLLRNLKDREPFAHLMHKVFRAGWRFADGDRPLDIAEFYVHVWTVWKKETEQVLAGPAATLTTDDTNSFESTIRERHASASQPIGVSVETFDLVFGSSDAEQAQLTLLRRLLAETANKDRASELIEAGFEAGMTAKRLLTPVPDATPEPAA